MLRLGYFKHWFQPPYSFINFLRDELQLEVHEIDYGKPGYLDSLDIVIIEQNGFNDYIENDELVFREFVKQGGICWFMHQDYRRWAKYFLPEGIGYPILIDRYMDTITYPGGGICKSYMMPIQEEAGRGLFSIPNPIEPEDFLYWHLQVNSFGLVRQDTHPPEDVMTSAISCAIQCENWQILGSYQDCAVENGALILQAPYGKGLYFMNQILFPETLEGLSDNVLAFWKKYVPNLLAHFERHCCGKACPLPARKKHTLPLKRNYRCAIHLHALEWYGADHSLGVIQALMHDQKYDIATIAIKDAVPYGGKLDLERYSDERVLFLHGQEYHPFDFGEASVVPDEHSQYHLLSMGIDADAYTPQFTRTLFTRQEAESQTRQAIDFTHAHGGAVCFTHPYSDNWRKFDVDAVDHDPLISIAGTDYEKAYLEGQRFAMMNSVDMWGVQRLLDNPAANFVYIDGVVTRESFVSAVKAGHTIATCGFLEADMTVASAIPGDEVPLATAAAGVVHIHAKSIDGTKCTQIRIYSGSNLIACKAVDTQTVDMSLPLKALPLEHYVRIEISGIPKKVIAVSTPVFLR